MSPDGMLLERTGIATAIAAACARIAPLWPLDSFVAVNPFLGFSGTPFEETCATLRRVAGIDLLMPRPFYDGAAAPERPVPAVATVAEVLDRLAGGDKQASRTAFMIDEISAWCAGYFDAGQAPWPAPFRDLPPYPAWRAAMRYDRNAAAMGIAAFARQIEALPEDPVQTIAEVVAELGIPHSAVTDYLYRALLDTGGWAGYARMLDWPSPPEGRASEIVVQLLAIRVAYGLALFRQRSDAAFRAAWRQAMYRAALPPQPDPDLAAGLALHEAYEARFQRTLAAQLARPPVQRPPTRPDVQAVFCIDVRSEIFRRALEAACPVAETLGFAGFFGAAFDYVPAGGTQPRAQYPVLLRPAFTVCEAVNGPQEARRHGLRRRAAAAWQSFKTSALSCFGYVEAAGLLFAGQLARASARRSAGSIPDADGPGPALEPGWLDGRPTGLLAEQRVALAESLLKGMSLTDGFARLVLLAGHAGNSANNPYAAGLDCGACGGHSGAANARVAAAVLNDAGVRRALAARGLPVPDDCWFIAGLHDTTTDEVRLFGSETVPDTHKPDLAKLRAALTRAAALARQDRAKLLGAASGNAVRQRARDWAQTRPEWGLAGNAAFIAAPRAVTRGLDLRGRAFLHSYDWQADEDFKVLELIMTAPVIVANWINLQYFAATVNNEAFGSGTKVLHNVAGRLGVLEGNAGSLKAGLPWQAVHDGKRPVHEPIRLNVVLAAPLHAIDAVLTKHRSVRELVENRWLHLFALPEPGQPLQRRHGAGAWECVA